jgi:hypothetical protein
MIPRTAIVVTTIFEPAFLAGYLASIDLHGHREQVTVHVIGDRKTPGSVWEAAAEARRFGFRVECPTLEAQESYLARLDVPADFVPWNTDNRRNVGFLQALESGCDVLISIDDDNFVPAGTDFVSGHAVVGRFGVEPKVAMNAGLWLDDPDVDAISRLGQRPKMTAWNGESVLLDRTTWSPVNTQNTALTREAAFTYWYVRMGYPLRGLTIDRFGDILSGYFTQKCIEHVGQSVRVGSPVVEHRRTVHNLFKDLYHELAGMVLVEDLLPWLREVKLGGSTMFEAYGSLADEMLASADKFRGFIWDDGGREFLKDTAKWMQVWTRTVSRWG